MTEPRHNDDIIIGKLENLERIVSVEIAYLKKNVEALEKQNENLGGRINIVELWQANSMGKIAVLFTIIGIGVSLVVAWVSKHF